MSSKLNRIYCVICFCIGLLSFCKAQAPYTVTVSVRDDNIVTLTCRGSDSIDILSPVFSLNSTQQDLKTQLVPGSYSERSTSLAFQITQRLEGNYFCGPDLSSISSESPLTLIGKYRMHACMCTSWLVVKLRLGSRTIKSRPNEDNTLV